MGAGRSAIAQSQSIGQCVMKNHYNIFLSFSSGEITQRAGKFTKMRRRGLLQISKKELAAYRRQKRTSWEAGALRTQVADLIDVALQKPECLPKQWLMSWSMSEELHQC